MRGRSNKDVTLVLNTTRMYFKTDLSNQQRTAEQIMHTMWLFDVHCWYDLGIVVGGIDVPSDLDGTVSSIKVPSVRMSAGRHQGGIDVSSESMSAGP